MSGAPVLVTGGAGFLGRHLVGELLADGAAVRVLDPHSPDPAPQLTAIRGSILDPAALEAAMRGCRTVFHLAAYAHLFARDPQIYQTVNVEGTRAVLEAARRHGVERLVVVSSAVILRGWADPDPASISEASARPPREAMAGPYSRSKHAADAEVSAAAAAGLPVVTLYPTVPIGPGDLGMTAPTRMLAMLLERPPPAYLETVLDLVPVRDLARLCHLVAERGSPGSRYIAAGEAWAFSGLLDWLAERTGRPMPRRRVPWQIAALVSRLAEPVARHLDRAPPDASIEAIRLARHRRHYDAGRARCQLGWRPGPVEPALASAVDWLSRRPSPA